MCLFVFWHHTCKLHCIDCLKIEIEYFVIIFNKASFIFFVKTKMPFTKILQKIKFEFFQYFVLLCNKESKGIFMDTISSNDPCYFGLGTFETHGLAFATPVFVIDTLSEKT